MGGGGGNHIMSGLSRVYKGVGGRVLNCVHILYAAYNSCS